MLRKISERNAEFLSMDDAARRVAIAWDVIGQVNGGHLRAKAGTFVHRYRRFGEVKPVCEVCALGAVAVSLFNGEVGGGSGRMIRWALVEYFSVEQLALIESAFEGWDGSVAIDAYVDYSGFQPHEVAAVEGVDFSLDGPADDDRTRLLRIMWNIVRNRGTFVPEQFQQEEVE